MYKCVCGHKRRFERVDDAVGAAQELGPHDCSHEGKGSAGGGAAGAGARVAVDINEGLEVGVAQQLRQARGREVLQVLQGAVIQPC